MFGSSRCLFRRKKEGSICVCMAAIVGGGDDHCLAPLPRKSQGVLEHG